MKIVHSREITELPNKKTLAEQAAAKKQRNKKRKRILMLTLITLFLSYIIYLLSKRLWPGVIIMSIHTFLIFYSFAVDFYDKRNKKRAWQAYLKKYGVNGEIPRHVKMIHKKLIESGRPIPI